MHDQGEEDVAKKTASDKYNRGLLDPHGHALLHGDVAPTRGVETTAPDALAKGAAEQRPASTADDAAAPWDQHASGVSSTASPNASALGPSSSRSPYEAVEATYAAEGWTEPSWLDVAAPTQARGGAATAFEAEIDSTPSPSPGAAIVASASGGALSGGGSVSASGAPAAAATEGDDGPSNIAINSNIDIDIMQNVLVVQNIRYDVDIIVADGAAPSTTYGLEVGAFGFNPALSPNPAWVGDSFPIDDVTSIQPMIAPLSATGMSPEPDAALGEALGNATGDVAISTDFDLDVEQTVVVVQETVVDIDVLVQAGEIVDLSAILAEAPAPDLTVDIPPAFDVQGLVNDGFE